MKMLGSSRVNSIQALRGYAALFVAIGHLYWAFFSAPDMRLAVGENASKVLLSAVNNIPELWLAIPRSSIWVTLFFLISGFVIEISISKVKPAGFLIQRFFRIYSVFWVACVFHLIADIFIFEKPLPEGWVNNFFLITSYSLSPVSWTLIVEMHFYLIIAFLSAIGLSAVNRVIFLNVLFYVYYFAVYQKIVPAYFGYFMGEFFYFSWMSLGMVFYLLFLNKNQDKKINTLFIFTVVSVYFQYQIVFNNSMGIKIFSDYDTISLCAALAIFVSAVFVFPFYNDRFSNFLGDISYPLYCLHFPVGWVCNYFLIYYVNLSPFASLVISLLIVIFFSYLVHLFVENRFNSYGKKLSERFKIK